MAKGLQAAILALVCCLTMGAGHRPDLPTAYVDLIELNHKYDENGNHGLDQLIFYDWDDEANRYQVRDFRAIYAGEYPKQTPTGWQTTFRLQLSPITVRVIGTKYRETWTQYDPELRERHIIPMEHRVPLFPWMNNGVPPNPQAGIPATQTTLVGVGLWLLFRRLVE